MCAVTGSSLVHRVCGANFNSAYCMLSVSVSVAGSLQRGTMELNTSQLALLQGMCTNCVCSALHHQQETVIQIPGENA